MNAEESLTRPWPGDDDVVILQNECPARVFALLRAAQQLDARVHGSMALFLYANAAPEHRNAADLDALLPRDIDFVVPLDAADADNPEISSARIHACVASEMTRWVGPDTVVKGSYTFFRRAEAGEALVVEGYSGAVYVHHVYVNNTHMADFTFVAAKERHNLEARFACTTVAAQCGWEIALVRLVAWQELVLRLDSLCDVRKHAQRRQLLRKYGIGPRVLRRVILAPPQIMLPEDPKLGNRSHADTRDMRDTRDTRDTRDMRDMRDMPAPAALCLPPCASRAPLHLLDVAVRVAVANVTPAARLSLEVAVPVAVVNVAPRPRPRRRLTVTTEAHVEVLGGDFVPTRAPAPAPAPRVDRVDRVDRVALAALAAAATEHIRVMAATLDRMVCERLTALAGRVSAVLEQCCAFTDVAVKCHGHAKALVKSCETMGAYLKMAQPKGYTSLTERTQNLAKVMAANGIEPFTTILDLDGACFRNGDTMRTLLRRVIMDSFFVFQRALAMQLGSAEAACADASAAAAAVKTLGSIAVSAKSAVAGVGASSGSGVGVGVGVGAGAGDAAPPEMDAVFQTNFLALAQGVGAEVMRAHKALTRDDSDTDGDEDGSGRKKEVKSKKGGLYSAPFNDGLTHVFSIKTTHEMQRPELSSVLRTLSDMTDEFLVDDELQRLCVEPEMDDFGVAFTCIHANALGKLVVTKYEATANAAAHAVRSEDLDEVKAMRRHLQELKQGRVCFHTTPGTDFFSLECVADTLAQFCLAPSLQLTADMHNNQSESTAGLHEEIGLIAARAAQDLLEAQRLQSLCRALRRTCSTFSQTRFLNVAAKGVGAGRRRRR